MRIRNGFNDFFISNKIYIYVMRKKFKLKKDLQTEVLLHYDKLHLNDVNAHLDTKPKKQQQAFLKGWVWYVYKQVPYIQYV